jgi:ribosomal protein S18 acetylase RimI-like enzyme
MGYFILKPTEDYYDEIVNIHMKAFDGFFLTLLGKQFLKTYYKAVIAHPLGVVYCAVDEMNHLVGFGVGTKCSNGFHKKLLKCNFGAFMLQGVSILFKNPFSIFRLIKNMEKNMNHEDNGMYAELLSIGVLPSCAGEGIGKLLISAFEGEIRANGIERVSLTTDYYNNVSALEFYKKGGYEIFYDFHAYPQRRMYRLVKTM